MNQAAEFLTKTGTRLTVKFKEHGLYFAGDRQPRDIYTFTLSRNRRSYTATFGQSIAAAGQEPTAYDILSCMSHANEPETVDGLMSEFGYEVHSAEDYRALEKMARARKRQNAGLRRLFSSEELELLAEIN